MNGDAPDVAILADKIDSIDGKLDYINSMLDKTPRESTEKNDLAEKFADEQKQNRTKFNRFNQKQKLYQAIPITIDGISVDGKNALQKSLKNLFTFPEETTKAITKKKDNLLQTLALISVLLLAAYAFLKDKVGEFLSDLEKWLAGLLGSIKIGDLFSKIFEGIPKLGELLKVKFLEMLERFFKIEELTKLELLKAKFFEMLERFFKLEGLTKLTPDLKGLIERFKALPKKYLAMSVQELEKEIKALEEFIKYRQAYFNTAAEAQSKLLKDLEQLKKLKDAGMSAEEITRAVERFSKTQETLKKLLDLIKGPLEMLRASGTAIMEGIGKFTEGIGKVLEALLKFIPLGTKVFGLSKTILQNLGPVAVLIDSFETAIHLYDKAKTGKLGAEEITTALTTLVLRAIGWLGGLLVLPLAFLRRESIQDNIEKIFQSENIVEKITRMLLFPIDIIVKALADTMAGLADIGVIALKIVRKITGFFGGDKEKGFLELFLENFSAEIKKNIENFNLATLTMSIGEKIGEFIFDMVSSVLTWLKEKADTVGTAKNWLLSKMGFNKETPVADNKVQAKAKENTVPEFEPQKAKDFISRPGQKAIMFSSDDTIMGVKNPDGLNKKLIGELVKKIEEIRKEDRVTLRKLSDSITKLSTTTQANNNVNMVNNSRNVTSITISPTTSKSYRDSRMS